MFRDASVVGVLTLLLAELNSLAGNERTSFFLFGFAACLGAWMLGEAVGKIVVRAIREKQT